MQPSTQQSRDKQTDRNSRPTIPPHPEPPQAYTVRRPRVSDTNLSIVMEPFILDLPNLNLSYNFVGICRAPSASDRRLTDPTYLVFQAPLNILLNRFHHFSLNQLTLLAGAHSVTYRGKSKYQITAFMLLHECTAACKFTLFVFKELSRPRTSRSLRPWDSNPCTTFRVPLGNASQILPSREASLPCLPPPSLTTPTETLRASTTRESTASDTSPNIQNLDVSYLSPPTETVKRAAVAEWQKETRLDRFIRKPCAVCSGLRPREELTRVHAINVSLRVLRNDDLPPSIRPTSYNYWEYERAILEPQGLEDRDRKGWMLICSQCLRDTEKGKMPRFALCNWLYYARDRVPSIVKEDFRQLTVFEKALVCRVRTNSLMCRFSGLDDSITDDSDLSPFGNRVRHIRGNIISSPMDTARINDVLPPSPAEISDTICALIVGRSKPTRETIEGLEPILVRKARVKRIIEFLIGNNPHYRTSRSFRGFSSEHLDGLFKGKRQSGIPDSVKIAYVIRNDAVESTISDYTGRLDGLEGLFMENVAYTLGDRSTFSLDDMSLRALQHCKSGRPFLLARPGGKPVPDIHNPNWLSWAHPDADPFGIGGFHEPRRKRAISMEQQLRHLLNVFDPFFETDPTISFDVYNITRKNAVNTSLRFSVPYSSYSRIVNDIVRIDKELLKDLANRYYRNPSYKPSTPEEAQILRTMASISPAARNVPGSASQKIRMRNEIRAIISQRGSPTLFITLNPADYHNPIVAVLAKRCKNDADIERLLELTENQRANIALNHPVACAQFFDMYIKQFVRTILRYGRLKRGIFGHCDAYYGSVETQGRGTLHCHLLVWLRGHPPPETLYETLRSSEEHRTHLKTWLDSIIETGFVGSRSYLNNENPVTEEELRRGRAERHPGTIIGPQIDHTEQGTFWKEAREHIDDLLLRFNWHDHKPTCWKYLKPGEKRNDEACRFGMDGKVRPTTQFDLATGAVIIKRKHPKMTQYNPIVLLLMKCNTDLKFIGSGEDAKAFMYYVTDYITKAPLSIHAGLSALAYAIRQGESRGVLSEGTRDEFDDRSAMTIAINSMLGRQEISHPQAMSYILGNEDSYTSESFQPVNWGEIHRYVVKMLSQPSGEEAATDDRTPLNELSMSITNEGGQLNASNQLLDYVYRPTGQEFDGLNLYSFFATIKKNPRRRSTSSRNEEGYTHTGSRFSSPQHPQYPTHSVSKRKKEVVPILLGPRISRRKGTEGECEAWARDMCILFKPWREPKDLNPNNKEWMDLVVAMEPLLSDRERRIMRNMSLISEGKHARDKMPRERQRHNIDSETGTAQDDAIVEEDMDNSTGSITNVYQLLQPAFEDDAGGVEDDLYGHLERMIGDEAAEAFDLCLPNTGPTTSKATTIFRPTNPAERRTIEEQKRFMTKHKNRDPNQETPSNPQSTADQRNPSLDPDAPVTDVMTLPDTDDQALRKRLSWNIAKNVINRKKLKKNEEQLRAFQIVAHHAIEGGRQLLMYVGGKGGTGKSHVVEAIVDLFTALKRGKELRIGAPTGIAASLIGGNTIHSLLHVAPNNRSQKQRRLQEEWRRVKYFIIDEVSMVGAHFMATISSKLMTAKSDIVEDSCKIFGGINVLFLGDFYQLSPPLQPSLFAHKLVKNPTFIQTRNNRGIDSIAGAYLWRRVNTVVILRKSKRHSKDHVLGEILDRIRDDRCTDKFGRAISIRGTSILDHLRNRELSNIASSRPRDLRKFANAPVIVGSKMVRDALNACLLTAHARRRSERVYLYLASDFVSGKSPPESVAHRLRNLPTRLTCEALGLLPLFKGMKVMITENVSVPYGIVNGSEGTVKEVRYTMDQRGRRFVDVVYVKIPGCTLRVPGQRVGVVPIFPVSVTINKVIQIEGVQVKAFRRLQAPLVPAYAYTDYKSQGRTLRRAIVDINSARGQGVYVMLSRVTTLKGLAILRWFPKDRIVQRTSEDLRNEIKRLERLNTHTESMFEERKLAPLPEDLVRALPDEEESDGEEEEERSESSDIESDGREESDEEYDEEKGDDNEAMSVVDSEDGDSESMSVDDSGDEESESEPMMVDE